jgi:hypothetical protein
MTLIKGPPSCLDGPSRHPRRRTQLLSKRRGHRWQALAVATMSRKRCALCILPQVKKEPRRKPGLSRP